MISSKKKSNSKLISLVFSLWMTPYHVLKFNFIVFKYMTLVYILLPAFKLDTEIANKESIKYIFEDAFRGLPCEKVFYLNEINKKDL